MAKKTKRTETQPATETPKQTVTTTTAPVATQTQEAKEPPPTTQEKAAKGSNVKTAKSTAQNPVQVVHETVAEMKKANPQVTRKELMAACEAKGVAYYTARTQVQRALKAMATATDK